jgi:hypothetical protein
MLHLVLPRPRGPAAVTKAPCSGSHADSIPIALRRASHAAANDQPRCIACSISPHSLHLSHRCARGSKAPSTQRTLMSRTCGCAAPCAARRCSTWCGIVGAGPPRRSTGRALHPQSLLGPVRGEHWCSRTPADTSKGMHAAVGSHRPPLLLPHSCTSCTSRKPHCCLAAARAASQRPCTSPPAHSWQCGVKRRSRKCPAVQDG